ncbi:MAG: D-tyrosyl-tRNA(Tyr) deacylase [Gammaproteobacteria bacterium]|nr:D-tyrosyl-tRNA(Tyr) deacylase [Gammaproteobacteria bacterium]
MIALIQRVTEASVSVAGEQVASIEQGLLALIGVQRGDSSSEIDKLVTKVLGYRVFSDAQGRMNLGVTEADGALLLVPQFTLAADTRSGRRPGFSTAAQPDEAQRLFDRFCDSVESQHPQVQRGIFGADMQVALVNDGPVTFWLSVDPVH